MQVFLSNNASVRHLICAGGNDVSVYLHIEWESEWRWVPASRWEHTPVHLRCDRYGPFESPVWNQFAALQQNRSEPGYLFLVSQNHDVKNRHQGETLPFKNNVAPRQEGEVNKCIFHFALCGIHLACHPALQRVTTPSLFIRVPPREITRVIRLTSGWENLNTGSVQFPFVLHIEKRWWIQKRTLKSTLFSGTLDDARL